jgi:hypothetical protein
VPPEPNVRDVIEHALSGVGQLARLGESVEDEWQYIADLEAAWTERLREVADARGADAAGDGVAPAVERAVAEAALIVDPHRAIDWLSTFPQIVLTALGEPG